MVYLPLFLLLAPIFLIIFLVQALRKKKGTTWLLLGMGCLLLGFIGVQADKYNESPKQAVVPPVQKEQPKEMTFKEEAELNATKHPAKPAAVLYTNGDKQFTGMKYYFKGKIIQFNTIGNSVGNNSIWLVKNDQGYVMPIQHDRFKAKVGDTVEVWGTLTGDGYANAPGIDNVVGQTGSMHAIMVSVNGETQL